MPPDQPHNLRLLLLAGLRPFLSTLILSLELTVFPAGNANAYPEHPTVVAVSPTEANAFSECHGRQLDTRIGYFTSKSLKRQQADWAIGRKLAANTEQNAVILFDESIVRYVNQIEQSIVDSAGLPGCFVVKILVDPEPNAYSLPGGFVYLTTGLIEMADSEGQLAAALAHETAHVTARRLERLEAETRIYGRLALFSSPAGFSRDMSYIVLRPYWNVPPSILRSEIVPAIQRDRQYTAKKGYEVTTNAGTVVASDTVSDDVLAQLKAGQLTVRQKPGPTNALGLVKLMFPNEFNVYLHSTPAPELFSRARRDFSHGCIRVEKPAELTNWVLRNNPGWTIERVKHSMEGSDDNLSITLERKVPVFIVYATALAYDNGEVHFYDDIYGHDLRLDKTLAKGYP